MGTPIYKGKGGMGSMNDPETGGKKKKEEKKSNTGTVEGYTEDQKKRDAANAVMTKDTKAKTVRQGKLDRKSEFDKTKDGIRETRKKERQELPKASYLFDGSSERKKSRSKKRAAMRDARNAERGARRSDRTARQIKTLGDRNNMTVGEATKAYEARKATLNSYNKDAMKETATKVADNNAAIQAANDKAAADAANETGDAFSALGKNRGAKSGVPEVVSSIGNMLDMPTQQEATPDRAGMDLTTGRRGPGKFKFGM